MAKKKRDLSAGEPLFGYVVFRWTTIQNEIGRAIAHFPTDQLDVLKSYLSTIDGVMQPQRLAALEKCPQAAQLIREFADNSPEMSLKDASALYVKQSDTLQDATVALIKDGLIQWKAFMANGAMHGFAEYFPVFGRHFSKAEHAAIQLLSLDAALKGISEEEAWDWFDRFVVEMTSKANIEVPFSGHLMKVLYQASMFEKTPFFSGVWAFEKLQAGRISVLDWDRLGTLAHDEESRAWLEAAVTAFAGDEGPERHSLLWKAMAAKLSQACRYEERQTNPRPISLSKSKDPVVRHATRLIAMVHELHKVGYQRIRISPGVHDNGAFWRCPVTTSSNVCDDGFTLKAYEFESGLAAPYSSADGSRYFDIPGAEKLDARSLAIEFLKKYPRIAEAGQGRDWLYAGWLTDVLGRVEQGSKDDVIVLWGYCDEELRAPWKAWMPPPPVLK